MTTTPTSTERRQSILARMEAIPVIVPGKLSERRGADGKVTGHKLQHWSGGRNLTRHVPEAQVATVEEGTEGYRQFQQLAAEYAGVRGEEALAADGDAPHPKKKSKRRSPRGRANCTPS
jgi:hypothetical protein